MPTVQWLMWIGVAAIAFLAWVLWRRHATDLIERLKVLRLRCFSQTFEFVLDTSVANRWKAFLPAHRIGEQTAAVAR